jgi:hypothetical protein
MRAILPRKPHAPSQYSGPPWLENRRCKNRPASLGTKGEAEVRSPIGATSRSNRQDVDRLLARSTIEDDAPPADAQSPEPLGTAEAFDVTLGKLDDRGTYALAILSARPAEGLQGGGADLDPPSAWISQRSAPPRRLTKRCLVRSAPP